jgi:hypothetical protein
MSSRPGGDARQRTAPAQASPTGASLRDHAINAALTGRERSTAALEPARISSGSSMLWRVLAQFLANIARRRSQGLDDWLRG